MIWRSPVSEGDLYLQLSDDEITLGVGVGTTSTVWVDHSVAGVFSSPPEPVITVPIDKIARVVRAATIGGMVYVTDGGGFVVELTNVAGGVDISWSWTREGTV